MGARKAKRIRQAAYSAGPMYPWRAVSFICNEAASRRNRAMARGDAPKPVSMEIGRIESFRFISSEAS